jgi:hypothetical protein
MVQADYRVVRVSVRAADFKCEGSLQLPPRGGYKSRVHDLLNDESVRFLALSNVLMYEATPVGAAPEEPLEYDVILLRKDEIKFLIPLD